MKTHRFDSHNPEAACRLSDLGHRVEGAILATIGFSALLGAMGQTGAGGGYGLG